MARDIGQALRQARDLLCAERSEYACSMDLEEARREAALEAEVLLGHVLGLRRTELLSRANRIMGETELRQYESVVARRRLGEPVAYITGRREFYGIELLVDRRVLVPRPETELLVEKAITELRQLGRGDASIADVGTGSGAIAIALAKHVPTARIFAIDCSAEALALAAVNCRRQGVAGQVTLLQGDLLSPLAQPVQIVVANLPYISPQMYARLPTEIRLYEPQGALLALEDGLGAYRRLLAQVHPFLLPRARLILEIDGTQGGAMEQLVRQHLPAASCEIRKDLAQLDRVVVVRLDNED